MIINSLSKCSQNLEVTPDARASEGWLDYRWTAASSNGGLYGSGVYFAVTSAEEPGVEPAAAASPPERPRPP